MTKAETGKGHVCTFACVEVECGWHKAEMKRKDERKERMQCINETRVLLALTKKYMQDPVARRELLEKALLAHQMRNN